ncbi:helix-turn-helix domain-containing protein [Paenibacillus sp. LHD-117]|uniref:helix-turn-helix domain-containing protein n=1 Tax=Paenibacillus sp. LHD-117 TaxID=3071412 RepID=UPI0027E1E963|nr:helix-turn-helix domain-containing protein [Paenibacillus sp. LHD-117]MDQ6423391.1 helix-turn-helix domain-containing protein [Paenibacillus sp. LHD-117]
MFNLLVVDDEDIAIRGIQQGIDWSDTEIGELFTAYDAEEAKELLLQHRIDILLSDIDMPNENGIELLRWVNENRPDAVTLFLTGHADFVYAQQALHLDCFDYLLKPIDHAQLKSCIAEAVQKVKEQRQFHEIKDTFRKVSEQWRQQRPALVERFWQDYIHYRLSVHPSRLEPVLDTYEIPLLANSFVHIIVVSIEQWREEWSARDEEIMTYAVKNAAAELLLGERAGTVVQEPNGMLYVIGYNPEPEADADLASRCSHFIEQCRTMLHCQLSCYAGSPVTLQEARSSIQSLLEQEKNNVTQGGAVLIEADWVKERSAGGPTEFPFTDWSSLLSLGKRTELAYRIDECFDRMLEQKADYTLLASFYFGFMNMLFGWLNERMLQASDVFAGNEWEDGQQSLKSVARLRAWTHRVCAMTAAYSSEKGKAVSHAVEKVQAYMKEHLHEDFSREQAAKLVYLNPAYLSRLFRKETGLTLTDYLVELRMGKARAELANTNHRISDIAVAVGYSNFSHFSQAFKRATGLSPQEYRKKHQKLI